MKEKRYRNDPIIFTSSPLRKLFVHICVYKFNVKIITSTHYIQKKKKLICIYFTLLISLSLFFDILCNQAKKVEAAKKAFELVFEFVKNSDDWTDDDDSIDYEDAMFDELKETRRRACLKSSRINLQKFWMALPSNLEFIKCFEMNRRPWLVII